MQGIWNGKVIEKEGQCKSGPVVVLRCFHGLERKFRAPCGKEGCAECANAWRRRVKKRIYQGMDEDRKFKEWTLITFTACPHTAFVGGKCYRCGTPKQDCQEISVESYMESWKRWRKWFWREYKGAKFYRVFELQENGHPHVHVITDAKVPLVRRIQKFRKWADYRNQSQGAHDWITKGVEVGFGVISCNTRIRRGAGGAANYLAKYLSKEGRKVIRRENDPDNRSIRVAEGCRGWSKSPQRGYWWEPAVRTEKAHAHKDLEDSGCEDCTTPRHRMAREYRRYLDGLAELRWKGIWRSIPSMGRIRYLQILQEQKKCKTHDERKAVKTEKKRWWAFYQALTPFGTEVKTVRIPDRWIKERSWQLE